MTVFAGIEEKVVSFKTIIVEKRNKILTITLNRPSAKNSIDVQLAQDLLKVATACSEDTSIGAVILTGQGNIFCPGGDITLFAKNLDNLPYLLKKITNFLHSAISCFNRMDAPLIVAVNGPAAGAGVGLACLGDLTIAAESAHFTVGYTKIGLTLDAGTSFFLPRIVGVKKALEMTLTNPRINAQEALEMGLVSRVVPDANLIEESISVAGKLVKLSTKSLGVSKKLLYQSWNETLETHLASESEALSDMGNTQEARDAISNFLVKRKNTNPQI